MLPLLRKLNTGKVAAGVARRATELPETLMRTFHKKHQTHRKHVQ
jgi:hypothetical protein